MFSGVKSVLHFTFLLTGGQLWGGLLSASNSD